MGILSSMTETRASIEDPRVPISDPGVLAVLFGEVFKSAAGIDVTVDRALGVPSVWCAVNFISSSVAVPPLQVFVENGDDRVPAKNDPIYRILHDVVNSDKLTSYKWRKTQMIAALTGGRAYTYIERNRAGRVANLWPLDPSKTIARLRDRRTIYENTEDGKKTTYAASEIIDIPFMPMTDNVSHRSPIGTLKDTIGLSIAATEYASRFFQNGGVPPMALHAPPASSGAIRRAKAAVEDAIKRANEEQKNVLYLPEGHELKVLGFNPEQGQLIDVRLFQVQEVSRIYSLPPTFLHDMSHGTFTNTEQGDLHVVKHTLTQWFECWEQELNAKLFVTPGRFAEFNVDGFLRGDFETRMAGMAQAVQNGLRSPEELRHLDNLPAKPRVGKLWIQGATVPLDAAGEGTGSTGAGDGNVEE